MAANISAIPEIIAAFEMRVRSAELCCSPVLLEPDSQPVAVGMILKPSWSVDQCSSDPFEAEFEEGTVVDFGQPIGDVNPIIGVDTDKLGVEGRVMQLRQRQAVRDDRLP